MSNCGRPRPLRSMNDDHSNPHLATLYRRWLSARYRGSTAAADSPRIGRTSIAQRSRFCALPQSGSCSENFVILTDVFGQTLREFKKQANLAVSIFLFLIVCVVVFAAGKLAWTWWSSL